MKTVRCLLIIAITLSTSSLSTVHAQSVPGQDCRYFPKTRHYVCGDFREYFETRGGMEAFGYPLSERFEDPAHERLEVQYFQRARMEWHPENGPAYQVLLGLLIDELGYRYPPISQEQIPAPDDPAHQYFPETGHVVSYAFLDYFRERGGLDIFGYPRSEFMYEGGIVVQYFQRARMEWDPTNAEQPIRLANVGEMYIERFPIPRQYLEPVGKERPAVKVSAAFLPVVMAHVKSAMSPSRLEPQRPPATAVPTVPPTPVPTVSPAPVQTVPAIELKVSASVRYPITGRTGTQTVFIYVNDQEARPIEGAEAQVVVHYPWGEQNCAPQPTDSTGFTWCSFEITSPTPGEAVLIDVEVAYGSLGAPAQTSFMPWW